MVITIGFFSVFQIDFDLTVLAAVLAVIGYSLNDTIVVYDRVRENFRSVRKGDPIMVFNLSLNQTLSRTLMTSLTTQLVLLALFFLGDDIGGDITPQWGLHLVDVNLGMGNLVDVVREQAAAWRGGR